MHFSGKRMNKFPAWTKDKELEGYYGTLDGFDDEIMHMFRSNSENKSLGFACDKCGYYEYFNVSLKSSWSLNQTIIITVWAQIIYCCDLYKLKFNSVLINFAFETTLIKLM